MHIWVSKFPVMLLLYLFLKFSADVQKFYQECDPGGFSFHFLMFMLLVVAVRAIFFVFCFFFHVCVCSFLFLNAGA